MIPKIIHYTWFSGEPFPEEIKTCVDSWEKHLLNYEFRLWNMNAINNIDSIFLKEAISEKKWAYAADFVRLFAIYNEGGIYLDTDVIVYRSFDPLLDQKAFIGKENSIHFEGGFSAQYLTSHCFGAEKGHPFIKKCLDYFERRHFITSNNIELPQPLRYNFILLPYIQAEIAHQYGYDWNPKKQDIQNCKLELTIFPTTYFDPINIEETSFCKHLALGSWRIDKPSKLKYNLRYKIEWRLIKIVKWLLYKAGYATIRLD